MAKKLLILGGGTGGLIISKEVREVLGPGDVEITVVDMKDRTEFRPSYLYVAFGYRRPEQISVPLEYLKRRNVNFVKARVTKIDPANRKVSTTAGDFTYDDLVVALGAETVDTGFPHTWELEPSLKVAEALSQVRQGHVVIGVYSLPYRCPPAPIELAMLTHFYYLTRGLRDKVKITVVHPLKRPFENFGPVAAKWMTNFLQQLGIEYVGVGQSQAIKSLGKNELETATGEKIKFDVALVVPPHKAPDPVLNSDLAKNGWAAPRSPANGDFRSEKYDDVYVVGDVVAPNVPVGMAGTILHSYAPWVVSNIVADLAGISMGKPPFRIVGTCALDVGAYGMAAACDFTQFVKKQKPYPDCMFLPPSPVSRIFKEMFEKVYFNWLLGVVP
ncbi:FAD-dependent pyridine nucleotide-disulfide oxidoreductase [Thermoproteus uzoniensis 768-20]|uniref:FAD-dependent pyridine nucleotide-disulfide oxidoreductase n=1 Tax=Thermoproteus uzoniensis (strain 768-20) TaxID=999630 RepID=F2L0A7_THEU7|nr:FAD/NAD(P)-binding oxidoreductase [Thermoproteus uzoniensis]AEA12589.1 FAD-dependent pyridine nucleotide-disulfide oxidoreductase [Thermoproteus uzoniensis 768-20]